MWTRHWLDTARKRPVLTFDCSQETTLGMSPTSLPSSGCVIRKSTSWPVGFPLWKQWKIQLNLTGRVPTYVSLVIVYLTSLIFFSILELCYSWENKSQSHLILATIIFLYDVNPAVWRAEDGSFDIFLSTYMLWFSPPESSNQSNLGSW